MPAGHRARVECLAEHDRGVLGGVVGAGLQVAGDRTSRSRRPWRASSSSMWSRKPTPVPRSPAPVPSSARRQTRTSVSPVVRSISASRSAHRWSGIRRRTAPPSTPRAPQSPPRARSAPGGRELGGCGPDPHLGSSCGGTAAQRASRQSVRRRLSAAHGWSPRRSRRRPLRCRHRRTGSRPLRTARERLRSRAPMSCRCSGANALARSSASRAPACRRPQSRQGRRVGRSRSARRAFLEALGDAHHRGVPRRRGCPRRARPGRACRARPDARSSARRLQGGPAGRSDRRSRRCRRCRRAGCFASCT